jgi:hypothetical protein
VSNINCSARESEMFERTTKEIGKRYRRMYRTTLSYTPHNVNTALQVYSVGVENHMGITEAVTEFYGYRYRRMENFIRELGLWKYGWLHMKIHIKLYGSYIAKKGFEVEITFNQLVPEHLYEKIEVTDEDLRQLFYAIIDKSGFDYLQLAVFRNYGYEVLNEFDYLHCCTQKIDDGKLIEWKFENIKMICDVEGEMSNYYVTGHKICPEVQDFEITSVEKIR